MSVVGLKKFLSDNRQLATDNCSRRRSSTESEQLATNEQVGGSSPSVFANFQNFRFQFDRYWLLLSANRQLFRGRLIGRTLGFEPGNIGSTPFPEANSIWDFGFGIWDLGFRQLSSAHCFSSKFSFVNQHSTIVTGRSTAAIWACFGNKCSQVRILLPGPIFTPM